MLIIASSALCVCVRVCVGGHHQDTKVRVNIRVKDVNDNPPEFATNTEVLMCETVAPGKVRRKIFFCVSVCLQFAQN